MFYVQAIRRCFREGALDATDLSQHDALKDAYVHESTLCVTLGASRLATNFRALTRTSKYIMVYTTFSTHAAQNTVCVTFGARRRSISLSLLCRPVATCAPEPPKDPGRIGVLTVRVPTPPWEAPPRLHSTCPRLPPDLRSGILCAVCPSVGGSAMHVKWPDGIGREAGIGRTRNRKELNVFRACPWCLALCRVTPRW